MRMKIIHKEQIFIVSNMRLVTLRIRAITDTTEYKHAKMLGNKPVIIERQIKGNDYVQVAYSNTIAEAGRVLQNYIDNITCGSAYCNLSC